MGGDAWPRHTYTNIIYKMLDNIVNPFVLFFLIDKNDIVHTARGKIVVINRYRL